MKAERVTFPDKIVVSNGRQRICVTGDGACRLDDTIVAASIDDARALRDMLIAAIADYEQKGPRT